MPSTPAATEGLPGLVETAPSPVAREIALVALAQRHTLGSLARALNARFGRHYEAANVARLLTPERMRPETMERFCGVLGIEPEHLVVASQPLIPVRLRYWRDRMLSDLDFDGPRFRKGTGAAVRRALEEDASAGHRCVVRYALTVYREAHGIVDRACMPGTSIVHIGSGWFAPSSHAVVVRELEQSIDLRALRRVSTRQQGALSGILLALHGLVPHELCMAIVAVSRAALVQAGHEVEPMDAELQATLEKLTRKATK
jgi:hypothetical protein